MLPDTVQEVLQERLDLLLARERTVLQMASVAGHEFRAATLKAMLGSTESADVDLALEGLLAHDLVAPARGGAYTFRHLLIRDVAYGTLRAPSVSASTRQWPLGWRSLPPVGWTSLWN